jgi:hypothetical protein
VRSMDRSAAMKVEGTEEAVVVKNTTDPAAGTQEAAMNDATSLPATEIDPAVEMADPLATVET